MSQSKSVSEKLQAQGREKEFRKMFKEADVSGDGSLSFEEIYAFLKKDKPNIGERPAMMMFSRIDRDHSGSIDFSEFTDFTLSMELLEAKKKASKASNLKPWDGPEQLKVNGSWDRETRLALQEFLAVQDTPTAKVVKPAAFVGGQMNAQHIIVLQELLDQCGLQAADASQHGSLACGFWDERTTKALNELLLNEGAPTALHIGDGFLAYKFGRTSVLALQEFLTMMRRTRSINS